MNETLCDAARVASILGNVLTAIRVADGYASPEELKAWHTSQPCSEGWKPEDWIEHRIRTLMLGLLAEADRAWVPPRPDDWDHLTDEGKARAMLPVVRGLVVDLRSRWWTAFHDVACVTCGHTGARHDVEDGNCEAGPPCPCRMYVPPIAASEPGLSEREWDIIVGALNEAVSYWKRASYGYAEILPVDVDPDEFLAGLEPRIKEAHTLMLKLDQRRAPEPTPDLTHRPGRAI